MDEIGISIIIVFQTNLILKGDRTQYIQVAYDLKILRNAQPEMSTTLG